MLIYSMGLKNLKIIFRMQKILTDLSKKTPNIICFEWLV